MRSRLVLTAGVAAAIALGTMSGCSSSSKASAGTHAGTTTSGAAGQTTSPTASKTASSTGHTAAVSNVCSLMTAAQATALNHVTYNGATSQVSGPLNNCVYKNSGAVDPVDIQDLTVSVLAESDCWTSLQSADGPGKAISGVGDAAFGAEIGIDIKDGSKCVTIDGLTHAELQGNYAPDIGMAKIILDNLH